MNAQPQIIDLTKIDLYCPTCETHKEARNRDGKDICCEECHTIITTIHPGFRDALSSEPNSSISNESP